jgi:hypothetical protein
MAMRTRQIRPVEICSNIYDFGDLQEGQFVALVGDTEGGSATVWYATVTHGAGLCIVLVRHILVEYDVYATCASVWYLQTCKEDVH